MKFYCSLTCFWPGCTQRWLHRPPRTFPLYLYLYFFWQQSERKYPDWNLWILFTLCFGYMQNNENCCEKHIPKFWYSLRVCFIWHILCEMWQQFLLFILVFISPYFITTWRQFLQQVMSKLHWFAEKNKISCKTNFLVDFIFPEIWLNLWYGEWCWRVRNSILDVKQTDI